jgi:hypothetical protein
MQVTKQINLITTGISESLSFPQKNIKLIAIWEKCNDQLQCRWVQI